MDYEQKYKEALELARDYYKANLKLYKADENLILEDLFPELRESEDEKIRKWLICGMNALKEQKTETFATIPIDDAIAWLENIPYTIDHEKREGFRLGYKAGLEKQGKNKDLPNVTDRETLDEYAYQVAYDLSNDWIKDTATWDDVERACKLGAEWNKKHHKYSWSEEDERHLNTTIAYLKDAKEFKKTAEDCTDWLKSLKDRYTWKPSDKQMEALNDVISSRDIKYDVLSELWKDLNKLREK